jgi:isopentenyl-diphosphate delta-isomerase
MKRRLLTTNPVSSLLAGHDAVQVNLMKERIIVVDKNDVVIRPGTKEECHINDGSNNILLHRAFSVFMFDLKTKKLLLQKRASCKITFPEYWANTCCSHPLFEPEEMIEKDHMGVKKAAIRKLEQELGIPSSQLTTDQFNYLGTLHYLAPGEGGWGEHEIDHVLGICCTVTVDPNPNEVGEARWFDEKELAEFMESAKKPGGPKVAPWFAKLHDNFLPNWWKIVREGKLAPSRDYTIHRL